MKKKKRQQSEDERWARLDKRTDSPYNRNHFSCLFLIHYIFDIHIFGMCMDSKTKPWSLASAGKKADTSMIYLHRRSQMLTIFIKRMC